VPDPSPWLLLAVQVAIAFGTISAVVLAVWGDFLRSRFAGPRLVLSLRDPRGELTTQANGVPIRFARRGGCRSWRCRPSAALIALGLAWPTCGPQWFSDQLFRDAVSIAAGTPCPALPSAHNAPRGAARPIWRFRPRPESGRPPKEIALSEAAPKSAAEGRARFCLDSFRDDLHPKPIHHSQQRLDHILSGTGVFDATHQRHVEFQKVRGDVCQFEEASLPCTEVVVGELEAEPRERVADVAHLCHIDHARLCDLEDETTTRRSIPLQRFEGGQKAGIGELPRMDVQE